MAIPYYIVGTATLTVGSTTMTGQGTLWADRVKPGDVVFPKEGTPNVVVSVAGNTQITLLLPYRGVAQAAQPYIILRTPDDVFTQTLVRDLLQKISDSTLAALAGMPPAARKLIRFDATANAALADLSDFALTLLDDADQAAARTTLGLGSAATADASVKGKELINGATVAAMRATLMLSALATQDPANVSISGGSLAGTATVAVRGLNATTGPAFYEFRTANNALIGYMGCASTNTDTVIVGTLGNVSLFPVPANAVVNLGSTNQADVSSTAGVSVLKTGSAGSFSTHFVNAGSGGVPVVIGNTNATAGNAIAFYKGGVYCGSVSTTTTTTSYNTSSDWRLKPIVENLVVEFSLSADQFAVLPDALRRLMALRPVRHNWSHAPDTWTHGFLAHEAQPVVPHAVTGEKDAVEDIGTATVPERIVEAGHDEDGAPIFVTVPAQQIPNIPLADAPSGSVWTKTGSRPVYQGMDHGKMVADLTAAIQGLTLLVLNLQARIATLEVAAQAA